MEYAVYKLEPQEGSHWHLIWIGKIDPASPPGEFESIDLRNESDVFHAIAHMTPGYEFDEGHVFAVIHNEHIGDEGMIVVGEREHGQTCPLMQGEHSLYSYLEEDPPPRQDYDDAGLEEYLGPEGLPTEVEPMPTYMERGFTTDQEDAISNISRHPVHIIESAGFSWHIYD